ncbi:MAG: hypothetical protein HOG80_11715 [Candidatus Marinimicrobia bacterium]|nr:hypothetical protein [Candidatus Neomarinimicrobiota bacterium]
METLSIILRLQPKTRIIFNRKTRIFESSKARRIPYETLEPLNDILVESALSELKRQTRRTVQQKKNQYMPEKWNLTPWNEQELQENFDECIYEQQLTQRLGSDKLTQSPSLEWVSQKEATQIFQVQNEAINSAIQAGRLKVLQRTKTQQMLIYLDDAFSQLVYPDSGNTPEEKLYQIKKEIKNLNPKLKPQSYKKWILPRAWIENLWPKSIGKKFNTAVLARKDVNENVYKIFRNIAGLKRENHPSPYDDLDVSYYNALWVRSRTITLGKPPLRYFTIEEAAFYLRLEIVTLPLAVHSGHLTPMKTDVGHQCIFEKKQLLAYAAPSSNPITANENTKKTLRWLEKEFQPEFTGTVPPDSESRMYMSEGDIKCEKVKIRESLVQLASVSFLFRAKKLFLFIQLQDPKIGPNLVPSVLRSIEPYTPKLKGFNPLNEGEL